MFIAAKFARLCSTATYLRSNPALLRRTKVTMNDNCKLPVTMRNKSMAASISHAFNDIVEQYCLLSGDPVKTAVEAISVEPDCALAHCAIGLISCLGQAVPLTHSSIAGSLGHAMRICNTDLASNRDKAFTETLRYWSIGQWRFGVNVLEKWLSDNPHDLFALKLCEDGYLFSGDSVNIRDAVARVFPAWNSNNYGYGFVLGMYAYGLEETGRYDEAIEAAQKALGMNKNDVWALHAQAHIYEMLGRANEGQSTLRNKMGDWEDANLINCHMAWHLALFYLDQGNYAAAKRIFDVDMAKAQMGEVWSEERLKEVYPFSLTDMTSLLWRMELYGADVESRWVEVAKVWIPFDELQLSTFNDMHAVMAYSAMNNCTENDEWLKKAEAVVSRMASKSERHMNEKSGMNNFLKKDLCLMLSAPHPGRDGQGESEPDEAWVAKHVGVPLCEGIIAYGCGDFHTACTKLLSIRHYTAMGGSHAQRDVIHLTLMEAAMRLEDQSLAKALLSERITNKPNSAQAWMRYGVVAERLGDSNEAAHAAHTAYQLGLGQKGYFSS